MDIGLLVLLTVLFGFSGGSIFYVYRYRGTQRWDNFTEYVRKGWPIFTPLNCVLYLCTEARAKPPIMDPKLFPELAELQAQWQVIREEALALYRSKQLEAAKAPGSAAYYDVGFRTFYKYGWSKFYLKWYGYTHASAEATCPRTVEILKRIPAVNGAMFSLLPAGSQLTRHLDPVAASLRYHLGLSTPNDDRCWINIDGTVYSWRDGEPLIFDETFLHHAKNDTDAPRLILMCDVRRPMNIFGRAFNFVIRQLLRMSVVPNTDADRRGLGNRIFATLAPLLARTKQLKQTNKLLYTIIKHTINLLLLLIAVGILVGIYFAVTRLLVPLFH
jgi:beta-hydroxylase